MNAPVPGSAPASAADHVQAPAALLAELDAGFAERTAVLADGARVAYRSGGRQGSLVVLLHGISSGAASWLPCASLLAAQARVLAWDAPGYGASAALAQPAPRASDYAARLAGLLEALALRPDVIVGHSLGALMAAAFVAQARPALLPSRLLLLSPAQGYGAPGQQEQAAQVSAQRLQALAQLGVEGLAERGPQRLLSAAADAGARDWVRWNMRRLNVDGYRQAVAMLCGDAIEPYLQRRAAGVDARVACGGADVVTTPAASEALAQRLGLPFGLVPDAGHVCYIEQPQALARMLRGLLPAAAAPGAAVSH